MEITVNRVGETNISTCGQKMKIIKYNNAIDIDIQFEDGTVVKHKKYSHFKKGAIGNPNPDRRVGEESVSSCGQKMKIIRYNGYKDIDVQFEDGTIIKNKSYYSFKNGMIKNPNYDPYVNRIGEEIIANCGQKMKIIRYNSYEDIDVKFEDGTIVKNKSYNNFMNGAIQNPNYNLYANRLGEENMSSCGLKMKIIKYNGSGDVDIQFEDGTIVKNKKYVAFVNGTIQHPNIYADRLGKENISSCGQKMKIVKYNSSRDIDIQFEDGTIVKNKKYVAFINGTIPNPNYCPYADRLGEENISSCGLKIKIVKYNSSRDIDVQFEDGTIISHRRYRDFKEGNTSHPFLSARLHSVYKNIRAKYAWSEGDKVYYICKCQKCGEEGLWTPQEMIQHAEKHKNEIE